MMGVEEIVDRQRAFFRTGATRELSYRRAALGRLRDVLVQRERHIIEALRQDMSKPSFEALASEWSLALTEVKHAIRRLPAWTRRRRRMTSLLAAPGTSVVEAMPYGVVLIVAPWNYPFHLSLIPLVGAVAAGNCAILKPSEYAPASSAALAEMIGEVFEREHVTVVEGGVEKAKALVSRQVDYIFFSGSVETGRKVMQGAAKTLTPVTLELGGKNPCIVEPDADIAVTARRIAWGKFYNAGQSCVAPDYLLVHHSVKARIVAALRSTIRAFYGARPARSRDFARIINHRHFDRLRRLLASGTLVAGGEHDRESLYIAPTLLDRVGWEEPVMEEEIFGPILPIVEYGEIDEAIETVNFNAPHPLALYLFTRSRTVQRRVLRLVDFGNGCINDTLSQVIGPHLPFGGIGTSGMGSYHGEESFRTFSRRRGMLHKPYILDHPLRYPPAGKLKKAMVRWLTRSVVG